MTVQQTLMSPVISGGYHWSTLQTFCLKAVTSSNSAPNTLHVLGNLCTKHSTLCVLPGNTEQWGPLCCVHWGVPSSSSRCHWSSCVITYFVHLSWFHTDWPSVNPVRWERVHAQKVEEVRGRWVCSARLVTPTGLLWPQGLENRAWVSEAWEPETCFGCLENMELINKDFETENLGPETFLHTNVFKYMR
jgi:hypothetical protein